MRLTRFSALVVLGCASLAAQTASFGGIAVNAVSGKPLSGVHLKLVFLKVGADIPDAYGAVSGEDGRFSITGITPGTYLLITERTGFVEMVTPKGVIPLPSVTLRAGDRIIDHRVEMTPRAVIAVRVVDEYGDPVPNVTIEARPVTPGDPVVASVNDGGRNVTTNLLGACRISGGPGKFYIKATPNVAVNQVREIRTDGSSDAAYGPVWYPSATGVEHASAVEARAGADVAIEIRMVRQRSITITGTVSGIAPGSPTQVTLATGDRAEAVVPGRSVVAGPDGGFSFSPLPPAFYRVTASVVGSRPLRSQSVDVKPDAPEMVDVQLVLSAATEVAGTVEIEGEPAGTTGEKRTVALTPTDFFTGGANATTESDGSFRLGGVFPGRYRVEARPLPDNGYVKTVEVDGVPVAELEVDFPRAVEGSRLKITLARDGAQLSGTVINKDGQPVGDTVAMVILAPDADHLSPDFARPIHDGGKYSFKGIRPGKYIVFAMDAFHSGPAQSLENLKRIAAAGEEIEIKAGARITKDLKVVLKEDADARSKK